MPALSASVRHLINERRGLLLLAGPDPAETEAGLNAVLSLLGDALPRRIAVAAGEEGAVEESPAAPSSHASAIDAALRQSPDLLIAAGLGRADDPRSAFALARDRVVIAPLTAIDAFDAAEQIACSGEGRAAESIVAGILGTRLIESLCHACAVPYDLLEVVPPSPRYRAIPAGEFSAGAGCTSCRGSGELKLQPVFEFLRPSPDGSLFRPGCRAPMLREDRLREGEATLAMAALHKASLGQVDVREPLRLMLHERH
jgi:type II secretory ATPase GspE/PulE/Tfp pilus assembly ATPase PilB-like protein